MEWTPRLRSRLRVTAWVLGVLGLCSALSVRFAGNYTASRKHLDGVFAQLQEQAPRLSLSGCVDALLDWSSRCEASSDLCVAAQPDLFQVCFQGNDRRQECTDRGLIQYNPKLGVEDCRARGVKGTAKKLCSGIYRSLGEQCRSFSPS